MACEFSTMHGPGEVRWFERRRKYLLRLCFRVPGLVLVGIDLVALARAPRGEVPALAEHPAVAAPRVGEDLPPVVVEGREGERVGAVLVGGLGDLLQPPLFLPLVEDRAALVDFLARGDVQAVVVE